MRAVRPSLWTLPALCFTALCSFPANAQTFREHRRESAVASGTVDEKQAVEVTLTLVQVAPQTIQTWIRAAGQLDNSRQVLTACIPGSEGALVAVDQRVRAFPPDSKSSIYQAKVVRVSAGDGCAVVEARLSGPAYDDAPRFLVEIIIDLGRHLAVPNEAIIEREGSQVAYIQRQPGQFEPVEIRTGLTGELYTEVLDGLAEGDHVATLGSFFIDADYRLNADPSNAAGNAHHNH